MTIKLREYIVTLVLFSLSTSSKPEPELGVLVSFYFNPLVAVGDQRQKIIFFCFLLKSGFDE
jgi:hypothetical protein